MDDEDIRHWQHLIVEHQRYLRILEEKVADFGRLNTPAHILKDIEDTKQSISGFEQRIRRRIRNARDDATFYSNEEVDEIYERTVEIVYLLEDIRMYQAILSIDSGNKSTIEAKFEQFVMERSITTFFILIIGTIAFVSVAWFFIDTTRNLWNLVIVFSVTFLLVGGPLILGKWDKLHLYESKEDRDIQGRINKTQKMLKEKQEELSRIYKHHIT